MKNIFIVIVTMVTLLGCSKDDVTESKYSDRQEKAFTLFNGTWADVQFSNIGEGSLSHLQPDPNKIVFGKHNSTPIEVYKDDYMNGKVFLFDNQGECTYHSMPYKDAEYEITECYYSISSNADKLRLYQKDNNSLFKSFDMSIKSETKINLHDTRITLPYIFVKQ